MVAQAKAAKTSSKPGDFGKKLLIEVANLHESGASRFWLNWPFQKERSKTLYALSAELRQIWDSSIPQQGKTQILNEWINYRHRGFEALAVPDYQWTVRFNPPGIVPDLRNLRGFLAYAALLNWPRLAVCGNPECSAKYFVAARRDQKFCGGDCTAYAQRRYALKYWNETGKERRAEKSKQQKARRT